MGVFHNESTMLPTKLTSGTVISMREGEFFNKFLTSINIWENKIHVHISQDKLTRMLSFEPHHEKTNILRMRKQRR